MSQHPPIRDGFSSRLGIIAAAAGSAIGLGNIWKFPYITGEYGGAAFILVYLVCIALIGLPIMLSEFIIGRRVQKNVVGAFKAEAPNTPWFFTGLLGTAIAFVILSFYGVVAGWSLHYIFLSATDAFSGKTSEELKTLFEGFRAQALLPIFWQILFMILTMGVVLGGVKKGIERYSKILMPLLIVLLILVAVRSITLEGASKGLHFLFNPDFDKINVKTVMAAMGHAFFSLSLGMGTMITYGSYINKKENLGQTALSVGIADTAIALLAGIAIFPAVFAFGIEPSAGTGLVFITLPNVFTQMPLGMVFALVFFFLLALAALTSSISVLEVVVAYLDEELGWSRKKSTILVGSVITALGAVLSQGYGLLNALQLSLMLDGKEIKLNIFDWFVNLTDLALPVGGFFIALFVGWQLDRKTVESEITNEGTIKVFYIQIYRFLIKFIAPLAIAAIFLTAIFGVPEQLTNIWG